MFDTNVLVSAILSPKSTNADALKKAEKEGLVVYSKDAWSEFIEVLFRPKFNPYVSVATREKIALAFERRFFEISPETIVRACRDPKDDMFLSLAIASRAKCIITNDADLLVLTPFKNISIVTPADFLLT